MWQGLRVGVVVPAFNEGRLLTRTLSTMPSYVDRIYVVDDASRDDTWQRAAGESSHRVVRIRHRNNRGVGAAITTGYFRGLADDMDVLCVMAGDGQMDPQDLPGLIAGVLTADYAKGNRFQHPLAHHMPFSRRLGSGALSWLTRRTTGLNVEDCQCGYTAIRASALSQLPLAELWPRYGYPNDLLALIAAEGLSARDVPVAPVYGDEASGLHAGHVLSIAVRILRRRRRSAPRSQAAAADSPTPQPVSQR